MIDRYFARSASDKTQDWPFWFVADRNLGGLNATAELIRRHISADHAGAVLTTKEGAIELTRIANKATE